MKIYRSKAPLRIGLAGGGTDVAPYSDLYGGAILNASVTMYAYASIEPRDDNKIVFNSIDKQERIELDATMEISTEEPLALFRGIYNRVVKEFAHKPLAFELTTRVDAPPGSGMGTSSTLVVAVLGAFAEWLKIPLGEYDFARLAYEIERVDLGMAGGKQDQYAATFGGVNYMEFFANDKVIVNPLRVNSRHLNELAHNLVLYYTETSRLSSKIIEAQTANVIKKESRPIEAMHRLKEQALWMKEALLKGDLGQIGAILDFGWKYKKQMAEGISNPMIDELYDVAIAAGASGGKISGAGGGGFMVFYCPKNSRYAVIEALNKFGGRCRRFEFTQTGLQTWST